MELNKEQVRELCPGIKIRKKLTLLDQQLTYLFFLDVEDLKIIDFQSDFTGSENINLKGMALHDRVAFKTVEPRTSQLVAQVELHEGWKLTTKFRFRRRPIPKEKQLQYLPEINSLQSEKTLVETILAKVDISLCELEQINKILEKSKIKFIDSEFPPDDISIVGQSDKNLIDDTVNHWRRPHEIFKGSYQLIDRINHNNLVKGKLSDNSFYSVVVCLSLANENLLEGLFMGHNTINPNGIYKLKLCKNGEWLTINVDDLIPCEPLGKPKFACSTLDDIWFSLLQKAYAKLHRRYLSLHDLEVSNVFADLTGCPTYISSLQKPQIRKSIFEHHKNKHIVVFYDTEEKEFDEDEFIPLKNYAYPLLSFEEEDGKLYYSVLSHTHQKQEISEEELFKKFKYMCVCYAKNWYELRVKGKFITVEAGTPEDSYPISMSHWYYSLDLPQASEIHLCLHQQDVLIGSNQSFKPYVYCSLLLMEKTDKSLLRPVQIQKYSHNREITMKAFLPPGMYLIIPFINSESAIKKPPEQEQILDIFRKLDLLMHRELKYAELVLFFKVINKVFNEEIFNDLLREFANLRKGIGLKAFREMWDKNHIEWKQFLDYYEKERLFTFSVHSDLEISILNKNNIGTQFNKRAHCELISKLGQELQLPGKATEKLARISFYRSKCNIIEYMVENRHDRKIEIELNCQDSSGYYFVPKSGKHSCVLDSGQKEFVMKLIPFEKCEPKDLVRQEKFKVKTLD